MAAFFVTYFRDFKSLTPYYSIFMYTTRSKTKKKKKQTKMETTNEMTNESMKEEVLTLKNELNLLKNSVKNMEITITKLESQVAVSHQVSNNLKKEIDKLQQYSRRSCLIIKDIPTHKDETVQDVETKVCEEITKCF